jgi:hypothetical protein
MMADLEALLGDLEQACEAKNATAVDAHTRTSGQQPQLQLSQTTDTTMAPTVADSNAVNNATMSQNINELDSLLRDLSNSRLAAVFTITPCKSTFVAR